MPTRQDFERWQRSHPYQANDAEAWKRYANQMYGYWQVSGDNRVSALDDDADPGDAGPADPGPGDPGPGDTGSGLPSGWTDNGNGTATGPSGFTYPVGADGSIDYGNPVSWPGMQPGYAPGAPPAVTGPAQPGATGGGRTQLGDLGGDYQQAYLRYLDARLEQLELPALAHQIAMDTARQQLARDGLNFDKDKFERLTLPIALRQMGLAEQAQEFEQGIASRRQGLMEGEATGYFNTPGGAGGGGVTGQDFYNRMIQIAGPGRRMTKDQWIQAAQATGLNPVDAQRVGDWAYEFTRQNVTGHGPDANDYANFFATNNIGRQKTLARDDAENRWRSTDYQNVTDRTYRYGSLQTDRAKTLADLSANPRNFVAGLEFNENAPAFFTPEDYFPTFPDENPPPPPAPPPGAPPDTGVGRIANGRDFYDNMINLATQFGGGQYRRLDNQDWINAAIQSGLTPADAAAIAQWKDGFMQQYGRGPGPDDYVGAFNQLRIPQSRVRTIPPRGSAVSDVDAAGLHDFIIGNQTVGGQYTRATPEQWLAHAQQFGLTAEEARLAQEQSNAFYAANGRGPGPQELAGIVARVRSGLNDPSYRPSPGDFRAQVGGGPIPAPLPGQDKPTGAMGGPDAGYQDPQQGAAYQQYQQQRQAAIGTPPFGAVPISAAGLRADQQRFPTQAMGGPDAGFNTPMVQTLEQRPMAQAAQAAGSAFNRPSGQPVSTSPPQPYSGQTPRPVGADWYAQQRAKSDDAYRRIGASPAFNAVMGAGGLPAYGAPTTEQQTAQSAFNRTAQPGYIQTNQRIPGIVQGHRADFRSYQNATPTQRGTVQSVISAQGQDPNDWEEKLKRSLPSAGRIGRGFRSR